jgi:hypothetical protein
VPPHPKIHLPQESSFRAFLARPENRPLVEEQQRLEVAGALALQEQEREARLREQVGRGPSARDTTAFWAALPLALAQ